MEKIKYCTRCKTTEGEFLVYCRHGERTYYFCRGCNTKRAKKYYEADGKDKIYSAAIRFAKDNPNKVSAWGKVSRAIKNGALVKPKECSVCNKTLVSRLLQAHHRDYSKPLDVLWLCAGCHSDEHKKEEAVHTLKD